ncbi:alpha-N-arabinofuranosidase [Actinopolymorpha pittospori]|uniref:non-reducing end alpha-L-arabinofuranosidase n=1 Tax=Actinopolymorpha pittospori TaxID=648752 RepID=A0A927MNX0_9ACTN|nr:alpha-L-arabinofuranosidase C-terminal domain-containing protein [Actinopolymorpha pittospori]MBE1603701.1 alpha-N-arabinofuranosidase [Actinopolymorpha pittospori]
MPSTSTMTAVVNADIAGPQISRHLYGHFAEHLGRCIYDGFYVGEDSPIPNVGGIRTDVVEALRQIAIPNLRWPGGCFADEYHWRDGIGPKESRPSMVNTHWGNVVENNHFGTHEFMALCELLDTEPYIVGNVGSGTVQEMADWVEYLTRSGEAPMSRLRRQNGRDEPWKVRFWGIGNETWGCGGNMRAEYYADLARQYATYCRSHDGNELYRIAVGARNDDFDWTQKLMQSISCLGCEQRRRSPYQALAFHYYTSPSEWRKKWSATEFSEEEYYLTMASAWRMDEIIAGHSRVMDCYDPQRQIGLVCDEWGTWWRTEEGTNPRFLYQQNTLRDALVASLHFDIFHQHADRMVMANIAQTVNVLQAMLLTDGPELVLTPTYHVFEMNKGHQDAVHLPLHLKQAAARKEVGDGEISTLSASASVKDGAMLLSATNLDTTDDARLQIEIRGADWQLGTARILTAPKVQSHNTTGEPAAVSPQPFSDVRRDGVNLVVDLPAHSFVTVEVQLG